MKIALVISSVGGGGAERVMANLANAWAREGIEITLITLASCTQDVYALDDAVERVGLDLTGHSSSLIQALIRNAIRVRRLRSALRACRPDVVISFMTTTNLMTILACRGLTCPVLVSERIFVSRQPPRGVWRLLYRPLYRSAAGIVAQTSRAAADLEAWLKRPVTVIPNPLMSASCHSVGCQKDAQSLLHKGSARWLLAVGRLSAQKGFDLLIDAFSRVAAHQPEWHLVIAGEGPERAKLTAQIAELELGDRIQLQGFCDAPQELMRQADLFVLSSRYEGMPNALLEAMAAGCPCISFDCESGPAELIESGVNGWLVASEDVVALTGAMELLMIDHGLRKSLGTAATEVANRFSLSAVIAQWNTLIASAIGEGFNDGTHPKRESKMFAP